MGRRNAYVTCEVRARPAVSVLFWVLDDNGTTLTDGEVVQEYWTLVMVGGNKSVKERERERESVRVR